MNLSFGLVSRAVAAATLATAVLFTLLGEKSCKTNREKGKPYVIVQRCIEVIGCAYDNI